MEAATTALTTLPLSTRILMTELAIFVKVEKMAVLRGSSAPCAWGDVGSGVQGPSECDGALKGRQRTGFFDDASHKLGGSLKTSREIRIGFIDLRRRFRDVKRQCVLLIVYLDEKGSHRASGLPLRRTLRCEMAPSLALEAGNSRARSR